MNTLFVRWTGFLGLTFLLLACGETPPTEDVVRARIKGVYCADNYRMELTDSTYFNRKVLASPLGTGRARESCSGNYLLVFEENQWKIRFEKDPRPRAIQNCDGEVVIWTQETGFVNGAEDTVTMPDLFDQMTLTKGGCDD